MNNIKAMLTATPPELALPLGFGKFRGDRVWNLPNSYWRWVSTIEQIPKDFFDRVRQAREYFEGPKETPAEIDFNGVELYDFQREWLVNYGPRRQAALFAEMGLGKTRTLLALFDKKRNVE